MTTLGSPGVQVNVIDESFYTPAAPGTIPLIFVATAANKSNASGTGIAQGTTAANAGTVWAITSQRDLTDTFGTPLFYTDVNQNPIHGGELNEYGLQAAYSLLGVSSRAYVVRADMDLGALTPTTSIPAGKPTANSYWIDTANTLFGINVWNSSTKAFSVVTPLIIDDSNVATVSTSGIPNSGFGKPGDFAAYVTTDNGINHQNTIFYKTSTDWTEVKGGFDSGKQVVIAPHTQYPDFTTSTGSTATSGSVWIKTTTPGYGSNWAVKYYNGGVGAWTTISAPLYNSTRQAIEKLDYAGGGKNIAAGTLFVETDPTHYGLTTATSVRAEFRVWRRAATSPTTITTYVNTASSVSDFHIRETIASSTAWATSATITVTTATATLGAAIEQAINTSSLVNISASFDPSSHVLSITHALGGDFELLDGTGTPLADAGFAAYNLATKAGTANLYTAPSQDSGFTLIATNWKPLSYKALGSAPVTLPADGTLWYDANLESVDIMYHNGQHWVGYQDSTAFPNSDPAGPQIAALAPTTQSDGSDLVTGDIWIDSSDPDMYGKNIYVWDGNTLMWNLQDVADQSSPSGWVFADARWSTRGQTSMETVTAITDLLKSNYVDPDAPDPALYPKGTHLWNLRRSGFNVKQYVVGHIDINANNGLNILYANDDMNNTGSEYNADRWVTVSPNDADGSGTFGRLAQRGYIVSKFKSIIDTNTAVRDTDTLVFNLLACPGYPEAIQNMIALNMDRKQTAFVVGDTPFRLQPNATALLNWGNNAAMALDNGDDGAVSYDSYMGMFYPSGYTNDNKGNNIVVPPSHMILRTIVNSDNVSYPWFAPAGTRRGTVDNATSVGYISSEGEFKPTALHEDLRNVMHDVKINPIATFPGIGIVNFGQYTRAANASALDRINVARLICYLRYQLTVLAKPYLFEPNDAQTRNEIRAAAESLMLELVGQRALYDFIVVCDTSNNTPARIDRSELWLDIAIEPVKAVEFIYIPLRILNTGAIASGNFGSTAA